MTMKLSNKQMKRIAKTIKGLGAGDIDWDETFEQDEAHAEFMRGEEDIEQKAIGFVNQINEELKHYPSDFQEEVIKIIVQYLGY